MKVSRLRSKRGTSNEEHPLGLGSARRLSRQCRRNAAIIASIALMDGRDNLSYVAPPTSFAGVLAVAFWIARKAPQPALLHGLLVGLVAMLIYLPLELSQDVTFAHLASSVLKVIGGAAGGFLAANRATAKPA